jgi:hypothetical protein
MASPGSGGAKQEVRAFADCGQLKQIAAAKKQIKPKTTGGRHLRVAGRALETNEGEVTCQLYQTLHRVTRNAILTWARDRYRLQAGALENALG